MPAEYSNFVNVFSEKYATVLLENTKIKTNIIDLNKDKQLYNRFIYSLRLVELETLTTYIKTNLANGFIRSFKSSSTLIQFKRKLDRSFCLCVNYQSLNNLIIKNLSSLPLIGESLD